MPGPLTSRRIGGFAFGKQTAVGTPLAVPTYYLPKAGGGMRPVTDRDDISLTGATLGRRGQLKRRARGAGSVTLWGHQDPIGLLIYAATGAQSAVTGAGPYTHPFTFADTLVPLTVYDLVGDDWWRFADTFVSRLRFYSTSGDVVLIDADLVAFSARRVASPGPPAMTDDEPRFKFIGGLMKLEADSGVPVQADNVESVEFVIDRAPDLRYATSYTPRYYIPDRRVNASASIEYDPAFQGWDFLSASELGAVAATGDVAQAMALGSFDFKFGRHPTDPARFLQIASNGANWEVAVTRPDSDPGGGAIDMDVAGILEGAGGFANEASLTLVNDVALAY